MNLGVSGGHITISTQETIKRGPGCVEQAKKILKNCEIFREIGFDSPEILHFFSDGYSMETIHGSDAVSFIHSNSPEYAISLFRKLINFILFFCQADAEKVPTEVVSDKMKSVFIALERNPYISEDARFRIFAILHRLHARCEDFTLPLSGCHGDLTLSNLIIRPDGTPVLIDAIPVFLESPVMDAAKLLQDARHLWTVKIYDGSVDRGRMKMLMGMLEEMILDLPFESEVLEFFSALNLVRILPYIAGNERLSHFVATEVFTYG